MTKFIESAALAIAPPGFRAANGGDLDQFGPLPSTPVRCRLQASPCALAFALFAFSAFAFWVGLAGAQNAPSAVPDSPKPPIVFAAASTKTALDAAAAAWRKDTGKTVTISYASSATLAKQIEQGAPADIFISADLQWMDYLDNKKLTRPRTRRNFLGNELVLIAPAGAGIKLETAKSFDLAGAAGDGKIAVCAIDSCPAGMYAKEALSSLGVLESVEPKLAQTENVRGALSLVSRGEAKLGIVYATDAKAEPNVKVIGTFPESSHSAIIYPIALTASSTIPDAEVFLAYLASRQAAKIFREQGFEILPK